MEEDSREPVEGEEIEPEEPGERRKLPIKVIAIILAVVVVGSVAGWYVVSTVLNGPPVAAFTSRSVDLRLSVDASNSSDPNGDSLSYRWDWGDQSPAGTGVSTFHNYAQEGNYTVALTVTDSRGAASSTPKSVVLQILPTPMFVARTERMKVSLDASSSFVVNGNVVSYAWDFGDGNTDTGVKSSHTYSTPGKYTVRLTVADNRGRTGTTSRLVSPASTTVDIVLDQFFQADCPYGQYWFLRYDSYGDQVLNNAIPCTSYYPWVLFSASTTLQPINPSFVYTIYRTDAKVRNHPGYSLTQPVILPVFNASVQPAPTSYVNLNLTFRYLDSPLIDFLKSTSYYNGSFAVNKKYSDGFGYLVEGNITMDLTASKRIFGVKGSTPAEAQDWWWNKTGEGTGTGPRDPGPLETKFALFLEDNGNLKYDIYNGFEWYYETDMSYLNATVGPDGTTRVKVFWDGWGFDVLLARWFYWGSTSYKDAVNSTYGAIQPAGWAPMEICWCEQSTIRANITSAFDLDFVAVSGYVFYASGDWGRDGIPGTGDDKPRWVLEPANMDYVPRLGSGSPGEGGYGNSEMRFNEGLTRIITSPGGYGYGEEYEYTFATTRWRLDAGTTIQLILPRNADNTPLEVPWYDPVKSKWDPANKIGKYVTYDSTMTLSKVSPANNPADPYYTWDERGGVLSFAGFHDWGTNSFPLYGEPWIEFKPETSQ